MKNWRSNYYKNLEQLAKLRLLESNEKDFPSIEDLMMSFLTKHKDTIDSYKHKNYDLKIHNGIYLFSDLLLHMGIKASAEIFEEKVPVIKSYAYKWRQPTIDNAKKYIKKTNGALLYESFFGDIEEVSQEKLK